MASSTHRPSKEPVGGSNEQVCNCDMTRVTEQLATLSEAVTVLRRLVNSGRVSEQTVDQVESQLIVLRQQLEAATDSSERLWEAVEADRTATGGMLHRLDRLEGAFDGQWKRLTRLELEALDLRKDLKTVTGKIHAHPEASEQRPAEPPFAPPSGRQPANSLLREPQVAHPVTAPQAARRARRPIVGR